MNLPTNNSLTSFESLFRLRGIRITLTLAFVLAVLIPAIIINGFTANFGIQHEIGQMSDQLQAIATLKEAHINLWLEGLQTELSRVTEDAGLLLLTRQALPDSLFPTRRQEASEELTGLLQEHLQQSARFDTLFLMTLDGEVIVSSDEALLGASYPQESPESPMIQPPVYSPEEEHADVTLFYPVIDRGLLIAVLGARSNLQQIDPILIEHAGLGETGETYLVDTNNTLLTPSRFAGYGVGQTLVNTAGGNTILETRTNGTGQYLDYRQIEVVGAYRWLPQLGVALLSEMDSSEVLAAPLLTIITNSIITVISVLVVIALALVVVERRITLPLVNLSNVARQFAEGNNKVRAEVGHEDEIGTLGLVFNEMIDRIQKRTQDLMRANALAQESARLKSQFLSTMSHELRTPLTAIIGFTGIMLQGMAGEIDDNASHMLTRISANGQRLLTLIDDVLNISKIEAGRMDLAQEPFAPRVLAAKLQTQLGGLAEQKGVALTVAIAETVPDQLRGDEGRVSQIITNLLSNAIKFTERGEVRLSMDWQDKQWIICVKDTGIGIPPHAYTLIFEAFRQLDGTSRRVYGGSGLGLSIARSLCAMMEGSISVESTLGQGSTFTVRLPLPTVQAAEEFTELAQL